MIIGVKRPSVYEDHHDYAKRFRLEESDGTVPAWASAEEVIAAVVATARRGRGSSGIEDSPHEPAEKRLRVSCGPADGLSPGSSNSARETNIRGWAESIIKTLHGCPSVEEATQRCARILTDVEAEVRQITQSEVERDSPSSSHGGIDMDERSPPQEGLRHTNRVLMRAVHHLAERCRRLEAGNDELTMLRQELEKAEEAQRRLQHSNEVLQHHVRLALGAPACGDRPLPWGHPSH